MITRPLRFLLRVAQRLRTVGLTRTASALSFTTLLGIVPLVTVAFASVARFPVFEVWVNTLEAFLLKHLVPATAYSVVHENLSEFVDNAARLTGISIGFLAIAALFATATVEREINLIWGIRRRRPLGRRLIVYALGLTAGPVLIGASISFLTTIIASAVVAIPFREVLLSAGLRPLPLIVALRRDRSVRRRDRARAREGAVRALHHVGADLQGGVRRARGAAGVPAVDLSLLDDRAGGRRGHRDADRFARHVVGCAR